MWLCCAVEGEIAVLMRLPLGAVAWSPLSCSQRGLALEINLSYSLYRYPWYCPGVAMTSDQVSIAGCVWFYHGSVFDDLLTSSSSY